MQVREAYGKWWKKKKSQSESLSKMFPTKQSTAAEPVSQVEHSMLCHLTLSAVTGIWSTKDEGAETTGIFYGHPYISSPRGNDNEDSQTATIVYLNNFIMCVRTTVELMLCLDCNTISVILFCLLMH